MGVCRRKVRWTDIFPIFLHIYAFESHLYWGLENIFSFALRLNVKTRFPMRFNIHLVKIDWYSSSMSSVRWHPKWPCRQLLLVHQRRPADGSGVVLAHCDEYVRGNLEDLSRLGYSVFSCRLLFCQMCNIFCALQKGNESTGRMETPFAHPSKDIPARPLTFNLIIIE